MLDFFQRIDPESGALIHDFTDPDWDTRFLGDLYQDLSEAVCKRHALLQTPEFVESFILDYTLDKTHRYLRFMWPYREDLYPRKVFGGQTYREAEKPWYEYGQIPVERFKIPLSITFAFVATHNHFVLDRGGKVFNRSAPVIKLPKDAIDARIALNETDPHYLSKAAAADLKARDIGAIPLPPKYASTDFLKPSYWPLRGKLDVPKERFFSLPHRERDGDGTLVIGWAGLDHLQRAQTIAAWYLERKENDGWDGARLKPMLVALDELIPWLKQWHNAIDPEFGERMGDYYEGFLLEELRQLDIPRDDLNGWLPPAPPRGRRRSSM